MRDRLPGISAHTLTHRLRKFEYYGMIIRTAFAETPPRVVYELTPLSESLRDVLEAMQRWGDALPDDVIAKAASRSVVDSGGPTTES